MVRLKLAVAAVFAVALAGCATETPTAVAAPDGPALQVIPVAGASFSAFVGNNDGLEFWDNPSVDGLTCNVGFYATGPFGPACDVPLPGSPANAGLFGGSLAYGTGANAEVPAPFTFEPGTYRVRFLDGFRGYGEEPVGWFTKTGLAYNLNPIAPAVSSQVNGEVTFTATAPWGFWIQPVAAIVGGDACSPTVMCSDDTKVQQFALFRKVTSFTEYLVGIEDQPGVEIPPAAPPTASTFPNGGGDKDFNDFFLSVTRIGELETLDGRMTGGGQVDASPKTSVSLTIHCDNKLSNNIQINWGTGQNSNDWHLDKNSLTNVICQYVADPTPPAAPINIFGGDATGTLNNVPGSKLQFKFVDNGEPNRGNDFVSLKIWDANNNVVLDLQNVAMKTGNIQAHYDQPHKSK